MSSHYHIFIQTPEKTKNEVFKNRRLRKRIEELKFELVLSQEQTLSYTVKFGVFPEIGTQIQCIPRAGKSNIIGVSSRWVEAGNRSHHRLTSGHTQHLGLTDHGCWFPTGPDASKSMFYSHYPR